MTYVIDTNVVVSAVLRPRSTPGRILDLMLAGSITFATSAELVDEYREVLLRPKFGFDSQHVTSLVGGIEARAEVYVPIPQHCFSSPDPGDQFVIDLAVTADATIVTGNVRHFLAYPRTITPGQLVDDLGEGDSGVGGGSRGPILSPITLRLLRYVLGSGE